ncbi:MAG: GNAT family N-acetyltransferase [Alphaproteobacteria bacterium]
MVEITTKRLLLRDLTLDDADGVFEYASDPEVAKYTSFHPHQQISESTEFLNHVLVQSSQEPISHLAVCLQEAPEQLIGIVGVSKRHYPEVGELSYVLARKHWQQGYMHEAAKALIKTAFKQYGFKRIFATCAVENAASKALMKRLGMQFEGRFRSSSYRKQRTWDIEQYAILSSDFATETPFNPGEFEYTSDPKSEDTRILSQGISQDAFEKKGLEPTESFGFFLRDEDGQVIAGCNGCYFFGCLYTDMIWVAPHMREQGISRRLLEKVEELAVNKNCTMCTLITMDFQALGLYQKLGYVVDLQRDGFAKNSTAYFLIKKL